MATNILPSGIDDLFHLAGAVKKGVAVHGPWLLQGTVTAEQLAQWLADAEKKEAVFARARSAKAMAGKRFTAADEALTSWLAKARLVVMLAYGSQWSESWIATGFTHRGTNVPKRIGRRMELGRRLARFFAEHPEFEVPFARVTVAEAKAVQKKIDAAEQGVRSATGVVKEAKRGRDAAEKLLRRKLAFVRLMIDIAIGKSDPRWQAFGFNIPRPGGSTRGRMVRNTDHAPLKVDFAASQPVVAQTAVA
ncbi:MAG: hypothetical protein ACR2NX_01650 [Chthoniobacterales bacterium]